MFSWKPTDDDVLRVVRALQPEACGMAIRQELFGEKRGGLGGIGWTYCKLDRLEMEGWLTSREEPGGPERNYRNRRFFEITESGMRKMMEEPVSIPSVFGVWSPLRA